MLQFDFENDLRAEIESVSSLIGFKTGHMKNLDKMLTNYLNVRSKIIDPIKRSVFVSPMLKLEISTHPKRREIEYIIELSRKGGNLNFFQSHKLLQANFHDHLRNEWNIFHFHLSLKREKKSKFVKQVNSLLFAYIEHNLIVFLGTDTHKEGIFADSKWIEILHDFFPTLIAKYKEPRITSIYPVVNAIERQMLWNKGFTLGATKIKNTIYRNPGIGRMSSGLSVMARMTADKIMVWLEKVRKQFQDIGVDLCTELKIDPHNASFQLRFGNDNLEIYEQHSQKIILMFPNIFLEERN